MSHTVAIGTTLGHYRIEEVLGHGGMGVVYRAVDSRLNRTVAVKFLSTDIASDEARRRFQREAQMASSLNHPHIVTVHDIGEWNEQQYVSVPQELFPIPPTAIPVVAPYDTVDGQKFLVLAPVAPANRPLQVIDNWQALLKQ